MARVKTWVTRYWRVVPAVLLALLLFPYAATLPAGDDVIYPLHLLNQQLNTPANVLFRWLGIAVCVALLAFPGLAQVTRMRQRGCLTVLAVALLVGLFAVWLIRPALSVDYHQADALDSGSHRYYLDAFVTLSDGTTLYFYQCDSNGIICTQLETFSNASENAQLTSNDQTVTVEAGGRRLYSILPQD